LLKGQSSCKLLNTIYDVHVTICVIFVKYLYVLVFSDLLKPSIPALICRDCESYQNLLTNVSRTVVQLH